MYIEELSEARIKELEILYEKDISDYQNKIICRKKFIYLIKKCNIMEFYYLYNKYIGGIESVRRLPEINFSDNYYIETVNKYDSRTKIKNHPKKNAKKLMRIEKMAQKKSYYKRHR